jgi:glycosyltransferase involved in cell wall biosynthesis
MSRESLVVHVTHVSPVVFGTNGIWGGGERYPTELARAMSRLVPTTLLSFAPKRATVREDDLTIELLPLRARIGGETNPLSEGMVKYLRASDVVHTHHTPNLLTDLALALRKRGQRVFSTDHGGSAKHLSRRLRLDERLDQFLPVSDFSARRFPQFADRTTVIYGGFDPDRFRPDSGIRRRKVVFVGRILPHKGIDVLIRALPAGVPLEIYGRSYHGDYLSLLTSLAAGQDVTFHHAASDDQVLEAVRSARACVLPSVYTDVYGRFAPQPELLGLSLLEAMGCGTPVIASAVGGMPEIVDDGETGFVVPPSDEASLSARIAQLVEGDSTWDEMSQRAADTAHARYRWSDVAVRCLEAYRC